MEMLIVPAGVRDKSGPLLDWQFQRFLEKGFRRCWIGFHRVFLLGLSSCDRVTLPMDGSFAA